MNSNLTSLVVVNNKDLGRFEAKLGDEKAALEYTLNGDVIIFTHTGVPSAFRGQRIAATMTRVALDFAKENRLSVVPRCWYTAAYIRKHPAYQPLVED